VSGRLTQILLADGKEDPFFDPANLHRAAELLSHLNGIRQSFEAKGWQLASEPPTA
jgi:hypothetical protein